MIVGAASISNLRDEDLQIRIIKELVNYAAEKRFREVYAIGWSNLPNYAQWGQEFMERAYSRCGFDAIDEVIDDSEGNALDCKLAGNHGENDYRRITEEIKDVGEVDRYRISLMKYTVE